MLKYEIYKTDENIKNLVIFLHGYNGTVADHQYAIDWLKQNLRHAVLIVPQAPEISDKNPQRFQWFGMLQYDADNRRALPETPTEAIFDIYNHAAADVDRCAKNLNQFIDKLQQGYRISNEHTFLCGFSQGAMLTIYTALTRHNQIGGAFVFSGLVAGEKLLNSKIAATPKLYLFHGKDDLKVQFKTLAHTSAWLTERNVPVYVKTFDNLAHRMNEEEIRIAADIINRAA